MAISNLDKNTLRARALGARKLIPATMAAAAAESLARHLTAQIPSSMHIIAGYSPIHSEIDVMPAMQALFACGHSICLPVVISAGQPLIFRRWHPESVLEKGAYGIDVPPASAEEMVPDAVLVPLAAFDAEGHRLGYGAGYYDRTIPRLRERRKDVLILGVAFSQQQIDVLPIDEHDQRLDAIVTERGWRYFS